MDNTVHCTLSLLFDSYSPKVHFFINDDFFSVLCDA